LAVTWRQRLYPRRADDEVRIVPDGKSEIDACIVGFVETAADFGRFDEFVIERHFKRLTRDFLQFGGALLKLFW
jgi:hypothetical protein